MAEKQTDGQLIGQAGLAIATGGVSLLFSKKFRRGVGRVARGGSIVGKGMDATSAGTGGVNAGVAAVGRAQAAWAQAQRENDVLTFDAMDELTKQIAKHSYSASRNAYSPFFSEGRASGERQHTGYTGQRPDQGFAPTPGQNTNNPYSVTSNTAPYRGMIQALGASQRRNKKPAQGVSSAP